METFCKTFFAHQHQAYNEPQPTGSLISSVKNLTKSSNNQQEDVKTLEGFLRDKFSDTWISVRKAFLDLDSDHDGFITFEDIIR